MRSELPYGYTRLFYFARGTSTTRIIRSGIFTVYIPSVLSPRRHEGYGQRVRAWMRAIRIRCC
jgi:hypothetical protein